MKRVFAGLAIAACLFVPATSLAFGTEVPTTLTNLHWTATVGYSFAKCSQLTDLHLDVSGALSTSSQHVAYGRATCTSASGPLLLGVTGTFLNTTSGFGILLYMLDYRIVCTLSKATLSSNACELWEIARGGTTPLTTFSLTYVP